MFHSGVLPSLVAFGGMRDTALRSPVEDLQKFSLCYGLSPPCSEHCRPSSHGILREHIYRIEHVHCWAVSTNKWMDCALAQDAQPPEHTSKLRFAQRSVECF